MFFTPLSTDSDSPKDEFSNPLNFGNLAAQTTPFSLLHKVLDELACGILLLTGAGRIRYTNRSARHALATTAAFCPSNEIFSLRDSAANDALHSALYACGKGKRTMLSARNGTQNDVSVAVVPIVLHEDSDVVALLTLGKCQSFSDLSLQFFGKSHQLTLAETRTLQGLCQGILCKEIANQAGVAVSTVRTHVRSILQKTEARGIRGIVGMVNSMAPMATAL